MNTTDIQLLRQAISKVRKISDKEVRESMLSQLTEKYIDIRKKQLELESIMEKELRLKS